MRDALSYRPLQACSGSIEMLHLSSRPRMLASKSKWILDAGCPKVVGSTQIIVTKGSLYPKSQYGCRLCGLCISGISTQFLSLRRFLGCWNILIWLGNQTFDLPQQGIVDHPPKSPVLAAILSLVGFRYIRILAFLCPELKGTAKVSNCLG